MGYEAPPHPEELDFSVASTHKAEVGGQKLNGFLTGIHSWRSERGMDVHQSAITHSYGSTTGGFAMRDIGEGVVDDFVYTGSPGISGAFCRDAGGRPRPYGGSRRFRYTMMYREWGPLDLRP